MGIISITPIEDNTPASANSINEPIGKIVAELNGNIDTANLKNSGVTRDKLAANSVTSDKLNFTKTIDDNGWTVYDYGTWKQYCKKGQVSVSVGAKLFNIAGDTGNLPVGLTTVGDSHVSGIFGTASAAITGTIFAAPTSNKVQFIVSNQYTETISILGYWDITIVA